MTKQDFSSRDSYSKPSPAKENSMSMMTQADPLCRRGGQRRLLMENLQHARGHEDAWNEKIIPSHIRILPHMLPNNIDVQRPKSPSVPQDPELKPETKDTWNAPTPSSKHGHLRRTCKKTLQSSFWESVRTIQHRPRLRSGRSCSFLSPFRTWGSSTAAYGKR